MLCLEWYLGWTAYYYHIGTEYHVFRDVLQTIIETPTFCILTPHTAPPFDPSYFGGHVMSGHPLDICILRYWEEARKQINLKHHCIQVLMAHPLSPPSYPSGPLPAQEVKGLSYIIIMSVLL